MNVKQKQDFLVNVAYWIFVLAVVYLIFKYVFPITVPFILGYCVAFLVVQISKKFRWNQKLLRIFLIVFFYAIIGVLISLVVLQGLATLNANVLQLPDFYEKQLAPVIKEIYDNVIVAVEQLEPEIKSTIQVVADHLLSSVKELFKGLSEAIIGFASGIVKAVPSLFLSILTMIISTFFFALDYETMESFMQRYVPEKWKKRIQSVKYYITNTLLVVIRSYAIIMLLTFTELSILFFILGFKNGTIIAGIIAVFDIMPILGSGGILIPWAVLSFIFGNYVQGIKLIIIYGIITVIRNYVEPKIVGAQLGIHPIITLVSMFVGLRLFGFLGLFGVPVAISFFWKKLRETGTKPDKNNKKQECKENAETH